MMQDDKDKLPPENPSDDPGDFTPEELDDLAFEELDDDLDDLDEELDDDPGDPAPDNPCGFTPEEREFFTPEELEFFAALENDGDTLAAFREALSPIVEEMKQPAIENPPAVRKLKTAYKLLAESVIPRSDPDALHGLFLHDEDTRSGSIKIYAKSLVFRGGEFARLMRLTDGIDVESCLDGDLSIDVGRTDVGITARDKKEEQP